MSIFVFSGIHNKSLAAFKFEDMFVIVLSDNWKLNISVSAEKINGYFSCDVYFKEKPRATKFIISKYSEENTEGLIKLEQPATEQMKAATEYRYSGSNSAVKNYVSFNGETWRIIGVFEADDGSGNYEQRVKIVRDESIGKYSWDTSASGINDYLIGTPQVYGGGISMDDKLFKEALMSTFDEKFGISDEELEQIPEPEFSRKFEKKMNKLVAKQKKAYYPLISTTARRVACIFVVITVFAVTTLSVDAVREQFTHFFVNIFNDHSEIKVNTDAMISDITKIDIESIEANIPEGFELVESFDSETSKKREYRDGEKYILIRITISDSTSLMIDNEQYSYEPYYDENGNEYMVNKAGSDVQTDIMWVDDCLLYQIISNMEKEQVFEILQ